MSYRRSLTRSLEEEQPMITKPTLLQKNLNQGRIEKRRKRRRRRGESVKEETIMMKN